MKRLLSLFNRITHYASCITVLLAFSLSPLAISLLITSAFAEEKTASISMEEIVVTATRTEKELASAPGSVSVVVKEVIEKRDVKTVDESLNTLSGVFNRRGKGSWIPWPESL